MPLSHFSGIKIAAIASAIPKNLVLTDSYKSIFGEKLVDNFKKMTGIEQHYETDLYQTASDLGYVAAKKILRDKNIDLNDIGVLIFAAHSTDYRRPATACVLHKRLGLSKNCSSFDISLGCSATVYGIQSICALMQTSDIKKGLLIVGETMSKMVHPNDKGSKMLFGDAGAAILFEKDEYVNNIYVSTKSDGNGYRDIIAPAGGFRNLNGPKDEFVFEDGNIRTLYNTIMNGTNVFSFSISEVPTTITEFLRETNFDISDFDYIALHQANSFIIKQIVKKIKMSKEKVLMAIDKYGNTSAPSIPLTLSHCLGNDINNRFVKILGCGFGVGLSWGVVSFEVNTNDIYPVIMTDEYFEEGIINGPCDFFK